MTTIQVEESTKKRLDKIKHENESYDTAVNRALDDNPAVLHTTQEIEDIVDRRIQEMREMGGRR